MVHGVFPQNGDGGGGGGGGVGDVDSDGVVSCPKLNNQVQSISQQRPSSAVGIDWPRVSNYNAKRQEYTRSGTKIIQRVFLEK